MTAKIMLLLLTLAIRHTDVFEEYGNKMDKTQIKFATDLYLSTILEDFKCLGRKLQASKDIPEKERLVLEMIELIEYYDELDLIPAIKKHWPEGGVVFDMLLKLRQDKDKIKVS